MVKYSGAPLDAVFSALADPTHRKLVFTWAWNSTPERESLITLTFRPSGSGTEFNMLHEQLFDVAARDRHEHGWTGSLAKLGRFLQEK